jgi:hypothetical protein
MKKLLLLAAMLLFGVNHAVKAQAIPYDSLITIKVVGIDSKKDLYYHHVRFYHQNKKQKGVILIRKQDPMPFKKGKKKEVKLCKVIQYKQVTQRVDTTILSRSDNQVTMTLTTVYDTLNIRANRGMLGSFYINGEMQVDLSPQAKNPFFELCKPVK